ncbi:MAG: sodium/proton-translocating pyrophosphatase, partial [Pseudomonadota bacterium]|nr:sodium/proton-translocating pyrophosphatase [Pseudomonadota bacterium]
MTLWFWIALVAAVLAIGFGWLQSQSIMKADAGNDRMKEIASAIQEGANAYLNRQYRTIAMVGVGVVIVLAILFRNWEVPLGFVIGAVLSGAAGFIGMKVSVQANVRTTHAASNSLQDGLSMAFKSGAVTGLLVVGLALLGVVAYYGLLVGVVGYEESSRKVVDGLVALGFGASLISIFARLGGGI